MNKMHIFIMKASKSNEVEKIIVKVMKGYRYKIIYTNYPKHASLIARSYKNCANRIYAIGGDGMIHEIIQGLVGSQNELVILPMGTGNDFVRSLSVKKDIETILCESLSKEACFIDLIKANDIYCINDFCCAFDSDIANNVHNYKQIPLAYKSLQYVKVLIHRLFHYRLYPTKLLVNDNVIYEDNLVVASFNNGRYFGGGFEIAPLAKIDDGYIDINLVARLKLTDIPYYLYLLLTKRLYKGKRYYHKKLKSVDVISKQKVNIDGETYKEGTYHLEIVKNKLRIVI